MSRPTMRVRWFGPGGPVEEMPAAVSISAYDGSERQAADEERLFQASVAAQHALWANPDDVEFRHAYGVALRAWGDFVGHRGAKDFAYRLINGQVPLVGDAA